MNSEKEIVGALALDLERVALGLHRGSKKMAERFLLEVHQRIRDLEKYSSDGYVRKLVAKLLEVINSKKPNKEDDYLMFSTLFQNVVAKKYH